MFQNACASAKYANFKKIKCKGAPLKEGKPPIGVKFKQNRLETAPGNTYPTFGQLNFETEFVYKVSFFNYCYWVTFV
jgi:hypothetical protein